MFAVEKYGFRGKCYSWCVYIYIYIIHTHVCDEKWLIDFLIFGNSKNKNKKIIATIYENTEKGGNVMLSNCNFCKLSMGSRWRYA